MAAIVVEYINNETDLPVYEEDFDGCLPAIFERVVLPTDGGFVEYKVMSRAFVAGKPKRVIIRAQRVS